jgi:glucose/arabinose dehydrogenase/mono/diheme cytochrome c family protein
MLPAVVAPSASPHASVAPVASSDVPAKVDAKPVARPALSPPPPPKVPSIALSPAQSIATMQLPPGYHLQVVLSEPQVQEPVMIAFDGNGRMFVAEMRTYMQDADATGEFLPRCRVSMFEDTKGDGVYDRHTIFADNLVLPRILIALDDRVIIGETNTDDLYVYRDTNGDGVADEKKLWFKGEPRGGNLEHQPNGLTWALDNRLYATYYDYRLNFTTGTAIKETIPANGGQWGLTQDDWGKVWFVNAGGETGPVHFQQHILYGQFEAGGEYGKDFKTVWPIEHIPDAQGGPDELRADNSLNHFTATCGQDIFRGDRLPADLHGDLLFAEPAGRLIRRAKITVNDGITQVSNAYDRSEFIRATDPLFRPVNMVTAPDGTLYIVDMYRGIVQESAWTNKGSYLRKQIDAYHLAQEVGGGRIYRLTHDGFTPGPQPHMLDETPVQLVAHLSHPNGWWRDTAQKLLVLRHDLSVVPPLEKLAQTPAPDPRPRLHALWTLDGLGALKPALILAALDDANPEIRRTALRLAEPHIGPAAAADDPLIVATQKKLHDSDPNVVIQAMLSLRRAGRDDARQLIQTAAESSSSAGVFSINEQLWSAANNEDPFLLSLLGPAGLKSYRAGRTFYNSLCFACHGTDGHGAPAAPGKTIAPPLAGSPRVLGDATPAIAIVLHGFLGQINHTDFGAPMISLSTYPDQQLADVLTYVRNSFGNRGAAVTVEEVAARRAADAGRTDPWTPGSLREIFPALNVAREKFQHRSAWKLTASEASAKDTSIEQAIDDDPATGYLTTLSTPYPGQWFQVELPAVSTITSIDMDATASPKAFAPAYSVQVSNDGKEWGKPVASGIGEPDARIYLKQPVTAKFIRITLTEKQGWQKWAIDNLDFYGEEGK